VAQAVVCKNEVREKIETQTIISCILPHKKNAIQAKGKIKPGNDASFPGLPIINKYIILKQFELVTYRTKTEY